MLYSRISLTYAVNRSNRPSIATVLKTSNSIVVDSYSLAGLLAWLAVERNQAYSVRQRLSQVARGATGRAELITPEDAEDVTDECWRKAFHSTAWYPTCLS